LSNFLSGDELPQFVFCHFAQTVEVRQLRLQSVVGAGKPKPPVCYTMNPEGSANGITKPSVTNRVMPGKHLDSVGQSPTFNGQSQSRCEIVNVDPAFLR
jgi:hypothetical protein